MSTESEKKYFGVQKSFKLKITTKNNQPMMIPQKGLDDPDKGMK